MDPLQNTLNQIPSGQDTAERSDTIAVTLNAAGGNPEKDEGIPNHQGLETQTAPQALPERTRSATSDPRPRDHRLQWEWDEVTKDYIHKMEDGRKLLYTAYQKSRGDLHASEFKPPTPPRAKSPNTAPAEKDKLPQLSSPRSTTSELGSWVDIPSGAEDPDHEIEEIRPLPKPAAVEPIPKPLSLPPRKRAFEEPLDDRFKRIERPKRFFSVGRIFKTIWFEPRGSDTPVRRADLEWSDSFVTPFYGKKPVAKFRWFVVARKRLNHSLCFSITTFAGPGTAKSRRGRAIDFVVLHSSDIPPPDTYDEEGIVRPPIGVIIEEDEHYISPLARLDCSRLYTVEDDLEVMKIGRVNPDSLADLENYYLECVK